ncbi:hypothetical protein [Nocardia mangyaensis]|uniref:hypothetical protein n=1 Tax=Nocardia mangyaensis TaxID=2213200 RepID=UPI0026753483|nr:hypothetical protein [Nocardia mangyaensis]MDO3645969.1 hypothetical protein [Nocardia mangyaensis]
MARPMTPRRAVEALTVLVATSVAVLAIMLPISFASLTAAVHVDLLVFNIPRAMTGAAFVAAITAAITMAVGSIRTARWTALLALAGILVNHLALVPGGGDGQLHTLSLPTLSYIDALLAGIAFGALAVAVWREPLLRAVYLFAAIGATIIGDLTQAPTDATADGFDRVLGGALPLWFLAASVLALGCLAVTDTPAPRVSVDTAIPLAPIFAAVVAFSTIIVTSQALAAHKTSSPHLIAGAMVVVAAATAAAAILPGRDGILVLLMTGFAVTGSLVITVPRSGWVDVVTLVAVAVGLLSGLRAPRPLVAAVSVVVLAVLTLTADLLTPPAAVAVTVGCLALGLVSGYCVGAAVPVSPASATVGLAILFVPSIGVALSDSEFGHLAYSSSWYRTVEVDRGPVPAMVAVGMTLGCAVAIAALLHYRSPSEKASE